MTTITVQADATLFKELNEIAKLKHISLEDAAREALTWYVAREQDETPRPSRLPRFAGRWQDDRPADVIVAEIHESRNANLRSERIDW